MKTQDERSAAMESTLEKILGKIDKLSSREVPPIVEDKGSAVKGMPIVHINKSTHFGPHQQHPRYFYTPPDSTRAQFVSGVDHGHSSRIYGTAEVYYDLNDCPWSDAELEIFYELSNRDPDQFLDPSVPLPPKHQ